MAGIDSTTPPPPPADVLPPSYGAPHGKRNRRPWIITAIAAVTAIAVAVALVLVVTGGKKGGEVLLEPSGSAGPFPWTASVAAANAPTKVPLPSAAPSAAATGSTLTAVAGDRVGIYGGSMQMSVCDKAKLVNFLEANPGQAGAFARVVGVLPSQIRSYVTALTPVILAADTRVTNHGYSNGNPLPRQAVLQAGTAVMIDTYGLPRVKCYCGNPLGPPVLTGGAPRYTGPRWPGFSPRTTVVVRPASSPMTTVTVIDTLTGTTVVVTVGTGAPVNGTPAPQPSTQPTAPQPSAPLPTYQPPPQPTYVPPGPTQQPQPTTPAVISYQLVGITATRTYGGNIGANTAATNAVFQGTSQVSAATRSFNVGWGFNWPGDNPVNRNYVMGQLNLTELPTTLRSDVQARFSAALSGGWSTTGYAVPRSHLLALGGVVGSQSQDFPGEPTSTMSGSISSSGTYQTSGIYGNQFTITLTADIRFGDDHTGQLQLELQYSRTS